MTEDVHMDHPGSDPGVDRPSQIGLTGCVEPRGTTLRMRKVTPEVQESIAFGRERRGGDAEIW